MANSYTRNPIYIDTTFQSYKAQVATTLGTLFTLRVAKIYWFDPTTVGDVLLITDPQNGAELLRSRCEVAGQSQLIDWNVTPQIWRDFSVNELDSGAVKIYTKAG